MLRLDAIPLGAPPDDVNVFITAGAGAVPYALRLDDASGALVVTQLFHSAMRYPANVGVIPHTLAETGDPLQAAVVTEHVFAPGMVVAVRPLGVLYVSGDEGEDIVVLTVPSARLPPVRGGGDLHRSRPGPAPPDRPLLLPLPRHGGEEPHPLERLGRRVGGAPRDPRGSPARTEPGQRGRVKIGG